MQVLSGFAFSKGVCTIVSLMVRFKAFCDILRAAANIVTEQLHMAQERSI